MTSWVCISSGSWKVRIWSQGIWIAVKSMKRHHMKHQHDVFPPSVPNTFIASSWAAWVGRPIYTLERKRVLGASVTWMPKQQAGMKTISQLNWMFCSKPILKSMSVKVRTIGNGQNIVCALALCRYIHFQNVSNVFSQAKWQMKRIKRPNTKTESDNWGMKFVRSAITRVCEHNIDRLPFKLILWTCNPTDLHFHIQQLHGPLYNRNSVFGL